MCPVWTPLNKPPGPDEIQALSDDAMMILQALREAHRKKQDALLQSHAPPDPKTYYRTLYRHSFKQESLGQNPDTRRSSGEHVPSASEIFLDSGLGIKNEKYEPHGSHKLVAHMHGQSSEKENVSSPPCFDKPKDSHQFVPKTSQESIRSRHPDKEFHKLSMGFSKKEVLSRLGDQASCSDRLEHATSTCSDMQLARFSPGLPSSTLEGTVAVSSHIPDSPPIDTHYYQAFDKAAHELASMEQLSNSVKLSTDPGMFRWKAQEKFRDRSGICFPEAVHIGSSEEAVAGQRHRVGIGRDKNVSEEQVGEILGDSSRPVLPPREHLSIGRPHPLRESLGAVGPQLLVAGKEQTTSSEFGSRPTSGSKSTSRQTEGRGTASTGKVDHHSSGTSSTRQNDENAPSTFKRESTPSSKPQLCKRKAATPTTDEIFSDSNNIALRDKGRLIRNVADMTVASREDVGDRLARVDEVSMCVVYKDGSSQLREPETTSCKRRCLGSYDGAAECLLLAYAKEVDMKHDRDGPGSEDDDKLSDGALDFISIPFGGKQERTVQDWSRETLLNLMGKETVKKMCFDAQEMINTLICSFGLDHATVSSTWLVMDPKVAAWLLDADHPPITFSDLLSKYLPNQSETGMRSSTCRDLSLLGAVMKHLFYSLSEANLWQLFHGVEMKLCPILAAMEVQGICIHSQTLEAYGKLLQSKSHQIEQDAYKAAGHPFQITSHSQLRHVLFEELRIDKKYHGKKLARTNVLNLKSTSETVLLKLQALHPLPKLVLKYRQLVKLKSTYIDGILDCVEDGYVHTSWEQTSAASGRLQSANPNIQSIPKQPIVLDDALQEAHDCPNSVTVLARKPFVSHSGWSFIAADFQSIELRLLAHMSHDPVLVQAFNKRDCTDIFVELTSQWLGTPAADVIIAEREKTKRIVYSVIYGVGPDKLAETLGVSREEAKTFTKSFLGTFRGVSSFTRTCISCCQRHGFVQTIFKRRRLIPNINSSDFRIRSHAERQCVNFVLQGSAADICKIAMIQVVHSLAAQPELKARLLVQIHDELLLEVADEDVKGVKDIKADLSTKKKPLPKGLLSLQWK